MNEAELLTLWYEKIQTPEGQAACLYSLGMLMGNLLTLLEVQEALELQGTFEFLKGLRSSLIGVGTDISILDELWVALTSIFDPLKNRGVSESLTMWDHLLVGEL